VQTPLLQPSIIWQRGLLFSRDTRLEKMHTQDAPVSRWRLRRPPGLGAEALPFWGLAARPSFSPAPLPPLDLRFFFLALARRSPPDAPPSVSSPSVSRPACRTQM